MREEMLIPLTIFISVAVLIWKALTIRHAERMDMLARGLTTSDMRAGYDGMRSAMRSLKWGLVLTVGGAGFLLGFIIQNYVTHDINEHPAIMFGLTFISGGVGMLIYYQKARRIITEEARDLPPDGVQRVVSRSDAG